MRRNDGNNESSSRCTSPLTTLIEPASSTSRSSVIPNAVMVTSAVPFDDVKWRTVCPEATWVIPIEPSSVFTRYASSANSDESAGCVSIENHEPEPALA
jgi:hypothetical protein